MQKYSYSATERGIRERNIRQIVEHHEPAQQISTWADDLADHIERRRVEAIEKQRADGLHLLSRQGMPKWAIAILTEVADRHAICPSDITSRKRFRPIIEARREAAYLIKARKPMLPCTRIGEWFNKDHTSILHLIACHQAEHDLPKLIGYDLARVRQRNAARSAA